MKPLKLDIDPYVNDPGRYGVSLINAAEIMLPCLDAAQVRSVVEVGAYAGDLTGLLLQWAEGAGARVIAIDPSPQPGLVELDAQRQDLDLVRETSLEALQHIDLPDAAIIDGDHNYWTVSEELRLIGERAGDERLPLLLFHDVCWPHARRDDYFAPEQIPEEFRHPTTRHGGVTPENQGTSEDGIRYPWPAEHEGGPRNGVLTAVEDFVRERENLRLAVVPVFFGFGLVWDTTAPYADQLAELIDPWDGNSLLARLEQNRVGLLTRMLSETRRTGEARALAQRKDEFLRLLLESRAFSLATALSRLRGRLRGEAPLTRDDVRRALDGS